MIIYCYRLCCQDIETTRSLAHSLTRTLHLQTRQETDERLVRAIYFDHESIALIRKLYNLLDKNSDGVLSKEDFVEYNTMFEDKQVRTRVAFMAR